MKYAYLSILLVFLVPLACSDDTNSSGTNGSGGNGSSSSSSSSGEMSDAGADADMYQCGIGPGTMGNSKGVGKYCDGLGDCSGHEATLCATLGDPTAHFCTKVCDAAMPADVQCGENATCECNGGSTCGCTPAACTQTDGG